MCVYVCVCPSQPLDASGEDATLQSGTVASRLGAAVKSLVPQSRPTPPETAEVCDTHTHTHTHTQWNSPLLRTKRHAPAPLHTHTRTHAHLPTHSCRRLNTHEQTHAHTWTRTCTRHARKDVLHLKRVCLSVCIYVCCMVQLCALLMVSHHPCMFNALPRKAAGHVWTTLASRMPGLSKAMPGADTDRTKTHTHTHTWAHRSHASLARRRTHRVACRHSDTWHHLCCVCMHVCVCVCDRTESCPQGALVIHMTTECVCVCACRSRCGSVSGSPRSPGPRLRELCRSTRSTGGCERVYGPGSYSHGTACDGGTRTPAGQVSDTHTRAHTHTHKHICVCSGSCALGSCGHYAQG